MRRASTVLILAWAGLIWPAGASAFQNEISLKEKAAERTAEAFLELFALLPYDHGRANCGVKRSFSTRECVLHWAPGDTSGTATVTAFKSKKNDQRRASIAYRLKRRYQDCPDPDLDGKSCTAETKGRIVFRLRSAR
jgi:hypothetical protein